MNTNKPCPQCGTELEPYAEVDIGVGMLQGGPWGCPRCHWIEPEESGPTLDEMSEIFGEDE